MQKNAIDNTVMRVNKRKHAHQMSANACVRTRFSTRVYTKIVRAFSVCVGRLSLTCTVCATFNDFRFCPSSLFKLSANFMIFSLFLWISEICCLLTENDLLLLSFYGKNGLLMFCGDDKFTLI